MKTVKTINEAIENIKDGSSIMIGGFMCCGQPLKLVDAILEKGVKNLKLICNDAGYPDKGIGKLIVAGKVAELISTHIGLNPVAGQKMNSGEMKVELVPQGTLAERIRAFGAGLGGVLTPTGVGTEVEKGKNKIALNGKNYILETALTADFALIYADEADELGNSFVSKAAKNFNISMAMSAKEVIVETGKLLSVGGLDPEKINIPGVFVSKVVER